MACGEVAPCVQAVISDSKCYAPVMPPAVQAWLLLLPQKQGIADLDPDLAALVPDEPEPPSAAGSGAVAAAAVGADQTAQTSVPTDWRAHLKSMNPLNNLFLVIGVRFRGSQELEARCLVDPNEPYPHNAQ